MEGKVQAVGDSFRIKIRYIINLYIFGMHTLMVHFLFLCLFVYVLLVASLAGWFTLNWHYICTGMFILFSLIVEKLLALQFKRKTQTDQSCIKHRSLENGKLGKLTCEAFYEGGGERKINKIIIVI